MGAEPDPARGVAAARPQHHLPDGAIRAERIIAKVGEILDGATIESLPIPYTAVATDINARREVWFQRGPVEHAIRASIAIPGVITPAVINGRVLVDGGLINPIPIEPTAAASADLTIAVSLSGMRTQAAARRRRSRSRRSRSRARSGRPACAAAPPRCSSPSGSGPSRAASGAMRRDIEHDQTIPPEAVDDLPQTPADALVVRSADVGLLDLLNMSFDTMSALISRYRMASNPPDVLVTVPSNAVRTLDFHRAAEMIELGRQLTTEALDQAGY